MSTKAEEAIRVALPDLPFMPRPAVSALLGSYVRGPEVLEAGCGRAWPFKQKGNYALTGIDLDSVALAARTDLDHGIVGDLRTVTLPAESFDTIYSAFVLEHVPGAERVLLNMLSWLKPGGHLLLTFPDRDSIYGFFTRVTPFWFHVLYKRYVLGRKNAGKPGHEPYPTFHDRIISRGAFLDFVRSNGLTLVEEQGFGRVPPLVATFSKIVSTLSFGRLCCDHTNLMYVLRKARNS